MIALVFACQVPVNDDLANINSEILRNDKSS